MFERIIALDLGTHLGFCEGPGVLADIADVESGSEKLIHDTEPSEYLPARLGFFLRKRFDARKFDLIVAEQFVIMPGQGAGNPALILSVRMHGALAWFAAEREIPLKTVSVSTWRKHFCGRSTAAPRMTRKRTPKERNIARTRNKEMVRDEAALYGFAPPDCKDYERTDAIGIYSWSVSEFGRNDLPFCMRMTPNAV